MEYNCQNCDHVITVNFCSNCGQKKYKRIDKKYIWDEVQYTVLHTNKGFLYSIKSIAKNPGKTAREFIEGNRVNHYKPISLAFILSGISAFISYKIIGLNDIMIAYYSAQKVNVSMMTDITSFVSSYNSIIMLLFIPIFAIFTKIAFRSWGQNYYEHLVMNAFGLSYYVIVSILVSYPLLFIFRHDAAICFKLASLSTILLPIIMVWYYIGFYKERTLKSIILRVSMILLTLLVSYIGLIIAAIVFFILKDGPEAIKNFQ
jgi:Protein of unknown function (DUF3667)